MSPEPMDQREYREIDEMGEKEVSTDEVAHRENQIFRINGLIWFVFGVVEALIGIRVILKLLEANPANAFADFIYGASKIFLAPFFGLVGEPTANGSVLELTSIIAMLVYLLIGWGITRLVSLVMMPSDVRHMRTVRRH